MLINVVSIYLPVIDITIIIMIITTLITTVVPLNMETYNTNTACIHAII